MTGKEHHGLIQTDSLHFGPNNRLEPRIHRRSAASSISLNFVSFIRELRVPPREREMLTLIVEGLTAKEIADRLSVSIHTIDTHTRHLFKKLDVRSHAAAVARALRERRM